MEGNKYSRREFGKKLITGSVFAGGPLFFGLASINALAQTRSKNTHDKAAGDTTKAAAQQAKPATQRAAAQASTNPCDDMTDVPIADLEKRKKFAYVTKATVPDRHCGNCALFLKPQAGKTCGKCALFKGPVRPEGACTYWAPIPADG